MLRPLNHESSIAGIPFVHRNAYGFVAFNNSAKSFRLRLQRVSRLKSIDPLGKPWIILKIVDREKLPSRSKFVQNHRGKASTCSVDARGKPSRTCTHNHDIVNFFLDHRKHPPLLRPDIARASANNANTL